MPNQGTQNSILLQIDSGVSPASVKEDANSAKELKELYGDAQRTENLKQTLHVGMLWGLRIAAGAIIVCFVVRVIHLIAPEHLLWLTPERIQQIDHLLFSGVLGGLIGRYINAIISNDPKK